MNPHIALSIGEPQHPTPKLISDALIARMALVASLEDCVDAARRIADFVRTLG